MAMSRPCYPSLPTCTITTDFPAGLSLKKHLPITRKHHIPLLIGRTDCFLRLVVLSPMVINEQNGDENLVCVQSSFIAESPNTVQMGSLVLQDSLSYERHALFLLNMLEQVSCVLHVI